MNEDIVTGKNSSEYLSELKFIQEIPGYQQLTEYGRQLIKRMIAENPESVEYRERGEAQWKTLREMVADLQEDKYEWQPKMKIEWCQYG